MKNYPLKANKADWRVLQPQDTFNTEEYTADHYDLYLTTEYIKDEHNSARRYYCSIRSGIGIGFGVEFL